MKNFNISDLLNYIIKILIVVTCIYLYNNESLTIHRIILFIIVFLLILIYSRVPFLIVDIFNNKRVKAYIKINSEIFLKIVYILLEVYK